MKRSFVSKETLVAFGKEVTRLVSTLLAVWLAYSHGLPPG